MAHETSASAVDWSPSRRILFRVGLAYALLYLFPFPLTVLPVVGEGAQALYEQGWQAVVPWVGKHLLRLPADITVFTNGSGDTTYNYVQVLCYAVIALVVAVVWTAAHARAHPRLEAWLRAYIRFALGAVLIGYGSYKLVQSQFPPPPLHRLQQPLGDFSPMGLLWTFMGFSHAYGAFAGLVEFAAGALLFFRRTTTLGALLAVAVMSHVVVLNFTFDVPVKIYSMHLLALALYLLVPDAARLLDFFVRQRATAPRVDPPLVASARVRHLAAVAAAVSLLGVGGTALFGSWNQAKNYSDDAARPPLYGIYDVIEFTRDGQPRPPLQTDGARWKSLTIDRWLAVIVAMDGRPVYLTARAEPASRTLTLVVRGDSAEPSALRYEETGSDLVLDGPFRGVPIHVRLRRRDPQGYLLLNRGFHWVNEYPFNR